MADDRVQYGTPENIPLKYIDVSSGGIEAYAPAIAVVIDTGGGGGGATSEVEGTVVDGSPAANKPVLVAGEDSNGDVRNLQLNATGLLLVSVQQEAASVGNVKLVQGSKPVGQVPDNPIVIAGPDSVDGNISSPEIVSNRLSVYDSSLGQQDDASAGTDTGTFSLIALFKRLLAKFTTQFPAALTAGGSFKVSIEENAAGVTNLVEGTVAPGQPPDNPIMIAGADAGDNSVSVPFVVDGGLAVATYNGYLSVYQIIDANLAITQVSVSTSAVQIVATRNTRSELHLHNVGTDTIYIGKTSGVTTSNGFPLAGGREVTIRTTNILYGITASGTSVVGTIEVYS